MMHRPPDDVVADPDGATAPDANAVTTETAPDSGSERAALRKVLLAQRDAWLADPARAAAEQALSARLVQVLHQLEPQVLGLYWPLRSEFNAAATCAADPDVAALPWALPFAWPAGRQMDYRAWDKQPPRQQDGCGIPTADGPVLLPDVVLVPCVGYTDEGFRLGYGGGYFDRWLAAHPQVTAVGIAWSHSRLAVGQWAPEVHDQALMLVVTEAGVVGG